MNILLVEMEGIKGHHISSYLRSIVSSLINKKKKIILLTSNEIKKNQFYPFFKKNTKIICVKKINYPSNKTQINFLKFQLQYYNLIKKKFARIAKENKINHVYLNTLDFIDKPLSIYGSPFQNTTFSGLYLMPKFYIPFSMFSLNYLKKIIYGKLFLQLLKIKNLKNIFLVDPLCFNYLKKKHTHTLKKTFFINDLGTANQIRKFKLTKSKCQKILNIKKSKFVILVYGFIRENKSLAELVDAVSVLKERFNIIVLIAGLQDSKIKKFLKEQVQKNKAIRDNFIIINKYIDDRLEKIIFKATDVTWSGYSKKFYGSSGVLFLSSQNKVPVIGSDHGSLGWYLKKFKIGFSTDLTDTKKVTRVLTNLITNKQKIKYNFSEANKNRNFLNFGKSIVQKILEKK
jgi:glycosyltransferase involved in cell wall biosynthesis